MKTQLTKRGGLAKGILRRFTAEDTCIKREERVKIQRKVNKIDFSPEPN
jgi:hypothetical protein